MSGVLSLFLLLFGLLKLCILFYGNIVVCHFIFFFIYDCRELLTYTDGTLPLAETDLDIIAKSKHAKEAEKDPANLGHLLKFKKEAEHFDNTTELRTDNNDVDKEKEVGLPQVELMRTNSSQETQMALKLCFTLPSSCYATMAIRELLKTSTSVCTYFNTFLILLMCLFTSV